MMNMDYIIKESEVELTTPLHALVDWIAPEYQRKVHESNNKGFHVSSFGWVCRSGTPSPTLAITAKACSLPSPKHPSIVQ